jgi:GNAT superfamily N-acetyltransferase
MNFCIRKAALEDAPRLRALIEKSARELGGRDYRTEQIQAALGGAWGVDTQLIRDSTYFAVDHNTHIVACGGWSRRKTLFGSDNLAGREADLLDPQQDAARIRAFFVDPDWARRGLGRMLLERCESEARAEGFRAAELVATIPGERLYRTCGYTGDAWVKYPLPGGLTIDFMPMRRKL